MTPLDAAVLALLVLIGAGGYHQGLIRGLTRLLGLLLIAFVTLLLSVGISNRGELQAMILRTLALCAAIMLLVGVLTSLLNRAIPRAWHATRINKLLGVVPALLQGLLVATLMLGLIHRLALEPEMQQYLARGVVTGPLILPVSWMEQSLAGVR